MGTPVGTSVVVNNNPTAFERIEQFNKDLPNAPISKKKAFTDAQKKLREIDQVANQSINSWIDKPRSLGGRIKNKIRSFFHLVPKTEKKDLSKLAWKKNWAKKIIGWMGNKAIWVGNGIHGVGDKIAKTPGKTSATNSFDFDSVTQAEKDTLEKKANVFKTIAKVVVIAGGILLMGGAVAPLALGAFLITLPETLALSIIIGFSALGVVGVAAVVANPILKSRKPVIEHESKTNKEYQEFLNKFVQSDTGSYNLQKKDLQDAKLLQIFKTWKKDTEDTLNSKKLKLS